MNISDIRDRATISVPEAGELLGIGRDRAYKAVREGQMGVDQQMEKLRQDLRDIPPGVKVRPRVIDTPDDDER